jgi:voltage-gated potassium channel
MGLPRRLIYAAILLLLLITFSTLGYRLLGGPSVGLLQALYMAVITLAGVGYGEIVDTAHNPALRIFNMFIVLFGVAVTVYVFSVVAAFLVEIEVTNPFWRRRMQKRLDELQDHFLVCGLGDTGRFVVTELQKTRTPCVVIEISEDNLRKMKELHGELFRDLAYVIGDATEEEVLEKCGLNRAKGLVAALPHDKDNLVITVLSRQRFPRLRIVARATDRKFGERMMKAGASSTVSPNQIGGLRMASEAIRPHAVGFLDMLLKEQGQTLRVEELEIPPNSSWAGKRLDEIDLKGRMNLLVLGLKHPSGSSLPEVVVNPSDHATVSARGVIIALGDMPDIDRARRESEARD